MTESFEFHPELTYFLQVKIMMKGAMFWATPVAGKGSGDLANLLEADGFIELPANRTVFHEGESYPVFLYRSSIL